MIGPADNYGPDFSDMPDLRSRRSQRSPGIYKETQENTDALERVLEKVVRKVFIN